MSTPRAGHRAPAGVCRKACLPCGRSQSGIEAPARAQWARLALPPSFFEVQGWALLPRPSPGLSRVASWGSVPDFLSGPCLPVTRCCPSPWAASSCPVALHASSAPVRPCLRSAPRPVVPVSPQPLHRGVLGRVSPGLLPLSSFSRRDHLLVGTCQRNVFASPACSTERVCR